MYNTDLPTRAELPSSRQLIRSTLIALVVAGTLLTTAVLPAEYGIDPTGIGRVLGLTKMGEIKTGQAQEAAQDTSAAASPKAATPVATTAAEPPPAAKASAPVAATAQAPSGQSHETAITLKPGQAAEVKLDMRKGAKVAYRWTTRGGGVNFDTHGDPPNPPKDFYHGYGKGKQVERDEGVLEAAFDGQHGWFWRNRSQGEVTVSLSTKGQYSVIKRVL
jgi:hypothetical protein